MIPTDVYTRDWIIEKAKRILEEYPEGMTIRQLHYRLVAAGMINDMNHYKRVVSAMTYARWKGIVDMTAFIDRERSMFGETQAHETNLESEIERAKQQIKAWMTSYHLERWSNQDNYVEVWIEKKALQGVFEHPCIKYGVGLAPCKGYPSITFLNNAKERFVNATEAGKNVIILYFGDYDPSGTDIPRSIHNNLQRMNVDVEVKRIALNPEQIEQLKLPGVPPKRTDSRTRNWNGDRVVECDAVEPRTLAKMCEDAIKEYFDRTLYDELKTKEDIEYTKYKRALKEFIENMKEEI